jgi:hypothetical protein
VYVSMYVTSAFRVAGTDTNERIAKLSINFAEDSTIFPAGQGGDVDENILHHTPPRQEFIWSIHDPRVRLVTSVANSDPW